MIDWHLSLQAIQAVALIVAVGVALRAIRAQRKLEKQKNAIAVMLRAFQEPDLKEANALLSKIDQSSEESVECYAYRDRRGSGERKSIESLLNFYEAVSVGVLNDIYDEKIIRDCYCSMLLAIWERSFPFIRRLRDEHETATLYENFEAVVDRLHNAGRCVSPKFKR